MKSILFEYSSNDLATVFFWVEAKDNATNNWVTIAIADLSSPTNPMCFYRVGADWRENAPAWLTNFQYLVREAAPSVKVMTAGSKVGKLTPWTRKRRTFTAARGRPMPSSPPWN